jgi:CheY-like chemotaxis protein
VILLIVDDSPVYLKLLRAQLEGEGHEIVEATNGAEALKVLELQSVDAVISDILMPVMDGYRLCYEIRKSSTINSDVAIVLYTATYSSSSDRQLAETMDADYYLFKPAPTAAILGAVQEAQMKSNRRMNSRGRIDLTNAMDQTGVDLVRKLEVRNRELHDSLGTHQATIAKVIELNQRLETDVAQLTAALTRSHAQIEALTGHSGQPMLAASANVGNVERSPDDSGNLTPGAAKGEAGA